MERLSGILAMGAPIGQIIACVRCGYGKPATRKDGKTARVARPPAREKLTESYVQRTFEQTATRAGFIVLHQSEHRAQSHCDPQAGGCGRRFTQAGGSGLSEGVADTGISHPDWMNHEWLHYEAKGTETPWTSAKQEYLYDIGRNFMFRHPSVGLAQLLRDHQRRVFNADDRSSRFLRDYLAQYPPPQDLVAAGAAGYTLR